MCLKQKPYCVSQRQRCVRPTMPLLISEVARMMGISMSPMRLSIAGGILRRRFVERYGYEPGQYSYFIGSSEVVLYSCFDRDFDMVMESIRASEMGGTAKRVCKAVGARLTKRTRAMFYEYD